jgi:glycosyltransferase involved in cell wall biosynthesis
MNREQRRSKKHLSLVKDAKNKNRILWVSNAPWATTGYGQQSNQVISRLQKTYAVAVATNYGLEANGTWWQTSNGPIYIYPRGHETYSNDVIPAHANDWFLQNPEAKNLIITLFDTWVFKGEKWKEFKVASWVPIDHKPTPPQVARWCEQENVTPIAMSKFGQTMLERENIKSFYIPHAIENVFEPTEHLNFNDKKITGRDFLGLKDDDFVVGMNAANKGIYPNRKAFGENLMAFSIFAQDKPNAYLYIHADPAPTLGGIDIIQLAQAVGLKPKQLLFPDRYSLRGNLDQKFLAMIYSSFDVFLGTSMGEGFGIPTVEAQACGVPVIVSDFAASAELVGDGYKISGQPIWDAPQLSWFFIPFVSEIVDALNASYTGPKGPSLKAMEFAEQYRADTVFKKYWEPTLRAILSGKEPV